MKITSPIITKAYSGPPRRVSALVRFTISAVGIIALVLYLRHIFRTIIIRPSHTVPSGSFQHAFPAVHPLTIEEQITGNEHVIHPIDELIEDAEKIHESLLSKQTFDLKTAAAAYREKRGRHPPPGFDLWFDFAKSKDALIVEEFFDQIYDDLAPFWAIEPSIMRQKAASYEMTISIRNGKASAGSNWFWTQIWLDLIKTIQHILPDMDIALNAMDEPRIVVPWENMSQYIEIEHEKRVMPHVTTIISNFSKIQTSARRNDDLYHFETGRNSSFWEIATRGCHPDSPARKSAVIRDFSHTPAITLKYTLQHTYKGFVSNATASTDFCNQPDLQALHGIMIKPLTISSTKDLFPMFGGSKLKTNNEILFPAPMYWNNEERFSGGNNHGGPWADKVDQVIWRGVATGGRSRADNWKGFQRHRFVAMTNATKINAAENWHFIPENWSLPSSQYGLVAQAEKKLGEWTKKWANTGFVDFYCDPHDNMTCQYMSSRYRIVPGMMMGEQFNRKYLPDIDGNSFSGRYRGFLLSTSLPIKATLFREWHDCRLVPWKHFVPMDNRFIDFWGIMQYFLGYKNSKINIIGHDKQAKKIALDGQEWANKVLRKEDMQIYVLRLLLEYARLSDDRRDNMGWVKDLL
ncbi:Beta-1,2-xylosyltransferase 1 [Golovinomyces cichoracearum]|uniref:Beta-1,2-xylosyltransferase 1 n=1 Tax=Golovinomyces cichoracearum TaxID=62708 RepID=A0A420HEN4_9PEZI|nr:Beta-1,2-xylosyltransferase 1 [Golovinomyces cichoracearum]